jgi:outer membrane lipoprotein carrier protein
MSLRAVVSLTCAFAALTLPGSAQTETAADLAQALQKKYATVRDFSADFVQTYRGGVLNRQMKDTGSVLIKKPGKMRWEYQTPEEKLFVSDGVKVYWYVPQDRQVIVSAVPKGDAAPTPALFLAGRGSLTRDFNVSFTDLPPDTLPGSSALKLVARTPQPDYEWLVLTVDPATLALRGLVAIDTQGGTSSFSFSNLKENVGLADRQFAFDIPRGVEVVTDTARP